MKKEMIQTRNRKMNKKMIMKHELMEEDWTNNDDWLKSYNLNRAASEMLEIEHDEDIDDVMDKEEDDNIDVGVEDEGEDVENNEEPSVSDENVFAQSSYGLSPPDDTVQSLS